MGSVVKVLKELLPRLPMASTSFLPSQPQAFLALAYKIIHL